MAQTTGPNYHFLYFAPTLGAEWFFIAARAYFERFTPTVLTQLDFLRLIPEDATLVVTVVARRDAVAAIGVELAQVRPDAQMDAVVYDTLDETRAALDARAAANGPFGVPGQQAGQQIAPTPGSLLGSPVPTRPASGFVTQTPTPTTVAPMLPEPTETREALQPTPGSLIGG